MIGETGRQVTYEYRGCVETFVVFPNVVRIVLRRLPSVHCVKKSTRGSPVLTGCKNVLKVSWMLGPVSEQQSGRGSGSVPSWIDLLGGDSYSHSPLFSTSFVRRRVCFELEDGVGTWELVLRAGDRYPLSD